MMRSIHNIAKPASSAIAGEEPVLVYNSKEFDRKSTDMKVIPIVYRVEGSFRK